MRRLLAIALGVLLPVLFAGCGGGETTTPTPEAVEGPIEQPTVAEGDPEAGREVFDSANPGCGTCHVFEAADAEGTTGPNLDESLEGKDAQYIYDSIINPDAQITEGFQPNLMPKTYGRELTQEQLADLVAFLREG